MVRFWGKQGSPHKIITEKFFGNVTHTKIYIYIYLNENPKVCMKYYRVLPCRDLIILKTSKIDGSVEFTSIAIPYLITLSKQIHIKHNCKTTQNFVWQKKSLNLMNYLTICVYTPIDLLNKVQTTKIFQCYFCITRTIKI